MTFSIHVITDSSKIFEIEDQWNRLVNKCSSNPFFLSGFITNFIDSDFTKGWTPLVLIISTDRMIVGIAPLMLKKKFRFVRFPYKSWFSPNFILNDQYREACITHVLDFLFKNLRCLFVELILPAESPNLRILKKKCKANKVYFHKTPDIGHCIIPINCSWDEFIKLRGSNFRRRFRRLERKLNETGSWRIIQVKNALEKLDAIKKIYEIEKNSWKEELRNLTEIEDEDLKIILTGSQYTSRIEPDFKWSAWFLELNEKAIAYSLVLQYKKVAFIVKTSYDKQFKKFYPGIYINNSTIREIFNISQLKKIDWLTDLSFHRNWTSICLPRVRVIISRKSIIPIIIALVITNDYVRKIIKIIQNPMILRNLFLRAGEFNNS